MKMAYVGDYMPGTSYPQYAIARFPDGSFKTLNRVGVWKNIAGKPDPILDRIPLDGRDGIDGRDGVDGKDGRDGIDGKPGKRGKRGPAGKDGYSYHQFIGRRSDSTEKHVLTFPAVAGQIVTTSGLASMASPQVIGVAVSSTEYQTEGSVSIGGLTPGVTYYLDEFIPGAISALAPSTGYVVVIGRATDSENLDIEIASPIKL